MIWRTFLGLVVGAVLAIGAGAAVIADGLYGWSRAEVAETGNSAAFAAWAEAELAAQSNGNYAFVLIDAGERVASAYGSIGAPVDGDSLFQVASLSKWLTALGVLKLVDDGQVDLDAPISDYLERWSLPTSDFDNDGATVRRVLSHMAGLTDGLGYGGFAPGEEVQGLVSSLTAASDASPGNDGRVRVGIEPGTGWRYSGGGYALLQLLIEDVTGLSFEAYMQEAVFAPLGLERSTFVLPPETGNLAEIFDTDGSEATRYSFSAPSAAGLYTSAKDMALLAQSFAPSGESLLAADTLEQMASPEAYVMGAPIWGLGAVLYAPNGAGGFVFGHDGNNEPAINSAVRVNPDTGNAIVLLETGNTLLATEIAEEWVFWETGVPGVLLSAQTLSARTPFALGIAGGVFLLTLIGAFTLFRRR